MGKKRESIEIRGMQARVMQVLWHLRDLLRAYNPNYPFDLYGGVRLRPIALPPDERGEMYAIDLVADGCKARASVCIEAGQPSQFFLFEDGLWIGSESRRFFPMPLYFEIEYNYGIPHLIAQPHCEAAEEFVHQSYRKLIAKMVQEL